MSRKEIAPTVCPKCGEERLWRSDTNPSKSPRKATAYGVSRLFLGALPSALIANGTKQRWFTAAANAVLRKSTGRTESGPLLASRGGRNLCVEKPRSDLGRGFDCLDIITGNCRFPPCRNQYPRWNCASLHSIKPQAGLPSTVHWIYHHSYPSFL